MMKRLLMSTCAGMLVCGGLVAGTLEHNVGQGLGTMIFTGQDGLVQQVLAATTNGTCGNQTFAITTGTLGAEKATSLVQNETIRIFVAENMDNLARDIAMGEGETLATLVESIGVLPLQQDAFCRHLQKNFTVIYPNAKTDHLQVIQAIADLSV
jgi:hypothetical protein